jgi:iron complex transport system substrate-binding protein
MRIVTLLPAATEIACLLGLGDQLVGVSHECDHPPATVAALPRMTASLIPADATSAEIDALVRARVAGRRPLYRLDAAALAAARPDLIVTQGLCDVCAVDEAEVCRVAAALPRQPRVLNLEFASLAGMFDAIATVATAAGVDGTDAIDRLRRRVQDVAARRRADGPTVVFLEWLDPPFCGGHWNPELVELAGGRELIGRAGQPSRRITWRDVAAADPDVLVVAACGYDLARTANDLDRLQHQPAWAALRAVRDRRVLAFDGSAYFNRPGPRLVDSLERLAAGLGHCPVTRRSYVAQ